MKRLTVKDEQLDGYILKGICTFSRDGEIDDECSCEDICTLTHRDGEGCVCEGCPIREAFDKLAAYEETGYDPEDILQRLPKRKSVEKNPQLKAHWYIDPDGYYPVCSNCKCEPYDWIRPGHAEEDLKALESCPNCGAIMDERIR